MTIQNVRPWAMLKGVGPGFLASILVAGAAGLVATFLGGPIMLFALLIVFSQSSAVAPFIYTLF